MKNLFFLILALCFLAGCQSKPRNEEFSGDSLPSITAPADTAALREAAEKARRDSLIENALKGDSLKEKHLVVDKEAFLLFVRENGNTVASYPVCIGSGIGQKKRLGDHKTPEGKYKLRSIENATGYLHDFHDGKGKVRGAYGKWFFRLDTPQSTHIGIHGTLFPESMGKRESDGCVRLRNEDLDDLYTHVFKGMTVIINPDPV